MRFSPEQLSDPKRFDELRRDKEAFSRLVQLEQRDDLSHIELCRLAQYQLFQQDTQSCLATLAKARGLDSSYLERGIYLACLGHREDFRTLAAALRPIKFESMDPIDIEGYSLTCESMANFYILHLKNYQQAYAMLYRAETFATILNLRYRLGVISSKLEYTASLADDPYIPNPLTSEINGAGGYALRTRFSNLLIKHDVSSVKSLMIAGKLEKAELMLVQATQNYALALEGEFSYGKVAEQITDMVPDHYESRLYWSLLMLQIFSVIGLSAGRSHPERIADILKSSLDDVLHLDPTMSIASRLYPLGVKMASMLDTRIRSYTNDVVILENEKHGDGLKLNNKLLAKVTKPVREAIILDELYVTNENFASVTTRPLGHTQNRTRFEKSISEVQVSRSNFTSTGGVYRGIHRLGEALIETKIQDEAQHIYETSVFLKEVVTPKLLNF